MPSCGAASAAPTFGHPSGEGCRHFHADQLPQHRTRRLFEAVYAARQAQPRRIGRQRTQRLIDAIRRGVQIEQQAYAAQHLRRHQTERRRDLYPDPGCTLSQPQYSVPPWLTEIERR